jgi:arylsulfatase A-like enzyme
MRIFYLDLDSMRPDHFGCYGYHRNTTPNLDAIARQGVRFTHAYCNSSPCVPARASFLSGRFGVHHGAVRTPDQLFIRTYHPGLYPFDDLMLFDLRQDPHQTTNLAGERAELVAPLDHLLNEWLQAQLGHHGAMPDPMAQVIRTGPWKYVALDTWINRLRQKGCEEAAETIIRRLALDNNLATRGGHVLL